MSRTLRYLVTGREGQVVQSLLEQGRRPQHAHLELIAMGRPDLDLMDPDSLHRAVETVAPDLVISAAAYTAVDQAEGDEGTAHRVKALGPQALGQAAARLKIPVVHLSTDYVFDGDKQTPYEESDPVGPVSAYGRTKLAGEQLLLEVLPNAVILRTAWVYSPFGKNFAKTMLRLAETHDRLGVVADQVGNPTSALDIAEGILTVAGNLVGSSDPSLCGVFHMTGRGEASWAQFAEEILRVSAVHDGPTAEVGPLTTADYPTPARRPANSRLNNAALQAAHGVELPQWQASTQHVIERLVKNRAYL